MGGKMRSFETFILLSAAAVVRANQFNPCLNNEDVFFPDPADCSSFYECVDGDLVGHMKCPDGLLWDNNQQNCVWSARCWLNYLYVVEGTYTQSSPPPANDFTWRNKAGIEWDLIFVVEYSQYHYRFEVGE